MARAKAKVVVEEHGHAFLVVGTSQITEARKVLTKHLGWEKRKKVLRMPCRPLWHAGKRRSCVAFYFAIAPGAERKYKP